MSQSKAQFLNQFNQIKPNIVKIKVNSIAQFFLCTHCCLFFWLKKKQYILSSASLDVWKPKPKKSEKKCCLIIWNTMYICCCINYETRILRHDSSSSRLHHAASAFFYFFPSFFLHGDSSCANFSGLLSFFGFRYSFTLGHLNILHEIRIDFSLFIGY